jgi:hypothetical protein
MNIIENKEVGGDDKGLSKELEEKGSDSECRSPSTTEDTVKEEEDGEAETSANTIPSQATNADGIPNGGLVAWLQVLGSFFLFINCWCVRHVILQSNVC